MTPKQAAPSRSTSTVLVLLAAVGLLSLIWSVTGSAARGQPLAGEALGGAETAVVRVYYHSIEDLEALASYDVWEVNNTAERYVLVAVDQTTYAALQEAGWRLALDANATAATRATSEGNPFAQGYRTVEELYADLAALSNAHPALSELVVYGQSECSAAGGCTTPDDDKLSGFPLQALRITNEAIPGSSTVSETDIVRGEKPVLFLMANIHSREITTPELAMRMAGWLLDSYGIDPEATWLVDWHEIWIVPTANPDGHWLVELGTTPAYGGLPFSHRKNANQDTNDDGIQDCDQWPPEGYRQFGVDLNRNHSFGWGPVGSSGAPCDLTFRGPEPGSELEVSSLEALVKALIPDQREEGLDAPAPDDTQGIFITVHSYSELVLWPWGASSQSAPNHDGLKAIGDKLASFNGYQSCQPTACLYAASGGSDDFAYGELGIPAFTFEVGREFMPLYQEIDAVQWPENKPAFIYAARIARAPYLTALGPDSGDAMGSATAGLATLSVRLDDTHTGGNAIAAAEFSIDRPFWDAAHIANPLTPEDGSFNSPRELATAVLDVSSLPAGRHLVYFRGQDSNGHWGAVTAAFLDLGEQPETHAVHIPLLVR